MVDGGSMLFYGSGDEGCLVRRRRAGWGDERMGMADIGERLGRQDASVDERKT